MARHLPEQFRCKREAVPTTERLGQVPGPAARGAITRRYGSGSTRCALSTAGESPSASPNHIVDRGALPMIQRMAHSKAKSLQIKSAIILLLVPGIPALLFWIFRRRERKRVTPEKGS